MLKITTYRNRNTGEETPAHQVGVDQDGRALYQLAEDWYPTVPYECNEDGLAYAIDLPDHDRVIARVRQIDGCVRILRAQDAEHAARARALLWRDPAMIDYLDGVDGIVISREDA